VWAAIRLPAKPSWPPVVAVQELSRMTVEPNINPVLPNLNPTRYKTGTAQQQRLFVATANYRRANELPQALQEQPILPDHLLRLATNDSWRPASRAGG
jgi:hypothetical protein